MNSVIALDLDVIVFPSILRRNGMKDRGWLPVSIYGPHRCIPRRSERAKERRSAEVHSHTQSSSLSSEPAGPKASLTGS